MSLGLGLMLESPKIPSSADLFSVDELRILNEVGLPFSSAQEVRYARSLLERSRVNHDIVKNRYWILPADPVKGHEDEVQVGRGAKTSDFCGRWVSSSVCKNIEGHKDKTLAGVDCTDKIVVRHRHLWCHKSSCRVCFYRGWASREAKSIAGRVEEGERRGLGVPEHISVSVSEADSDLSMLVLRKKAAAALFDRGVSGFCLIPHARRIDRKNMKLKRSVHLHAIGFIEGGFDRCRECVHSRGDCASCDGFKGREVRGYARDGYIVKVHDRRKTIEGTAKYQLGHATTRLGIKRYAIVTWWGTMANRKYKGHALPVEDNCSVCGSEMVRSIHVGKSHVVKDVGSPDYRGVFVLPEFDADGEPNYIEVVGVGRNG
jgi:hypothetical protein